MSKFTITIDTDGAAFEDENELPNILRRVAQTLVESELTDGRIFDTNGNRCGYWELTK